MSAATPVAEAARQARELYARGDWQGARRLCRGILQTRPDEVDALCVLASIAAGSGSLAEAADTWQRVIALRPRDAPAHNNYGNVLKRLQRLDEAVASYERALALRPNFPAAYNNRGVALQELGRLEGALASFERALRLKPDYAEAYFNRAGVLGALQRFEAAVANLDRVLQLRPDLPEAHNNRGNALRELRRFDAALESFDAALGLRPDYAEAWYNRGNALRELQRLQEALASYQRALSLRPDDADVHNNVGGTLYQLGRIDEALDSYERALQIRPLAGGYYNRAVLLLLRGEYERGWIDYEWRWQANAAALRFRQPPWLGGESLEGKTILLHAEQGMGDTLQFCRYVPMVAALGARVILESPPPLATLLGALPGVAQLITPGEPLPPFDHHCPLLSLPLAFKTTLATIRASVPYLRPSRERLQHWQQKLGAADRLRVGLAWSGGFRPNQPELWPLNARRNIPLQKLAPLRHPGVEFYSLQKGQPAESELAQLLTQGWGGPTLLDYTAELTDFADTAALIEQLDLVISVDTSTAHLAGALGKPVWILNRFDTCWRWLLDRSDSPWYPTARLYRQPRAGDWETVVERVRVDLGKVLTRTP